MSRLRTGALCLVVAVLALVSFGACANLAKGVSGQAFPTPELLQAGSGSETPPSQTSPPPSPSYTLTTESPHPTQPPNKKPPVVALPPAVGYEGAPAKNPAEAVVNATTAGRSRGMRTAVAVLDLRTGAFYGAGDVDYGFASASVVKTFIAARLLADGKADDPGIKDQMWRMITASDDKAATALYPLVGREGLVPWVVSRYHVSGLAPANVPNYWGLTRITARGMVNFYAAVADDDVVGPWLLDAMAHAQPTGSDGFPQTFGIPAAAKNWRVKQGWMCCLESVTRMHSTGFIDGDRYSVALLTEGVTSKYGSYGAQTLSLMAQALLPGGSIPGSVPAPVPTHTKPTPTPTQPPPTTANPTPTDLSSSPA
jgi:hypothetical protein